MQISLSAIDRSRFGIVVAKATVSSGDRAEALVQWCKENTVEMAIARCSTHELEVCHDMQRLGFELMDTLVYFEVKGFAHSPVVLPDEFNIRMAMPDDAEEVGNLARKVFAGYGGHYHADVRLDRQDCDEVYSSWAANSCAGLPAADAMFLVSKGGLVAAFLSVKKIDTGTADIVLNGVDPAHQGKGLYSSLLTAAKNWAVDNDIGTILVSTQVTNLPPQKAWCRHGFEPLKSYYTFHKWFDK